MSAPRTTMRSAESGSGDSLQMIDPGLSRRLKARLALQTLPQQQKQTAPSGGMGLAALKLRRLSTLPPLNLPRKKRSVLKRIEQYASGFLKLGRIYGKSKDTAKLLRSAESRFAMLSADLAAVQDDIANWSRDAVEAMERQSRALATLQDRARETTETLEGRIAQSENEINSRIERLQDISTAVSNRLSEHISRQEASESHMKAALARARANLDSHQPSEEESREALAVPFRAADIGADDDFEIDALLDTFYARLEDRYRGARDDIRNRLSKYIPDAEAAVRITGKPVLDLGCGRGEWLERLRSVGIEARGVDLNEVQLRDARALGLDVELQDAAAFLATQPDNSLGMITAHHLVEHLPFRTLAHITRESARALAPGGILLYETPNVRNVVVGASSFHVDPTHRKPMPAEVLTTLMETLGFHPIETRFLHPHPKYDELVREERLDTEIAGLLFGPQDLAVLGTKPGSAA